MHFLMVFVGFCYEFTDVNYLPRMIVYNKLIINSLMPNGGLMNIKYILRILLLVSLIGVPLAYPMQDESDDDSEQDLNIVSGCGQIPADTVGNSLCYLSKDPEKLEKAYSLIQQNLYEELQFSCDWVSELMQYLICQEAHEIVLKLNEIRFEFMKIFPEDIKITYKKFRIFLPSMTSDMIIDYMTEFSLKDKDLYNQTLRLIKSYLSTLDPERKNYFKQVLSSLQQPVPQQASGMYLVAALNQLSLQERRHYNSTVQAQQLQHRNAGI